MVEIIQNANIDEYEKELENINEHIEKVINICFEHEVLDKNNIIEIYIEDEQKVHELNLEYRNVDRTTDVLSFPMFEKDDIENLKKVKLDHEEVLGSIILNLQKISEQAKDYGHSFKRELTYLLVHGFYHLMGYDHIEEEDKKQMREKEEEVLEILNISREAV